MNFNWEKAKEKYQNVKIPEQLEKVVNQTIEQAQNESKEQVDEKLEKVVGRAVQTSKQRMYKKRIGYSVIGLAAAAFVFVVGVNTSVGFAQSVSNIPVLGQISKVVMLNHIQENLETSHTDVKIPSIVGLTDAEFEKKVNEEIQSKVKEHVEAMQKEADLFIKAEIDTGTSPEEVGKVDIIGDYEVFYKGKDKVSFSVHVYSNGGANGWNEVYMYNFDVINNKELQLADLFQSDAYIDVISEEVHKQIKARMKEDSNLIYFTQKEDYEMGLGFEKISPNQTFYFNQSGDLVIFFEKYEIAPGYMDEQSFVIPNQVIASILK